MAVVNLKYAGSTATAVTCTLTSLANTAARQSTAIDNTTSLNVDYLLRVKTNGQASGTATLDVYVYGAAEGTTPVYSDGATGTDGTITATSVQNSRLLGSVQMNAATAVTWGPMSVAAAFGGTLPPKFGFIFINNSGAALSATSADHSIVVQGVAATVA